MRSEPSESAKVGLVEQREVAGAERRQGPVAGARQLEGTAGSVCSSKPGIHLGAQTAHMLCP